MAKAKIDLRPKTLDLELYAGDGVSIQLTVTDNLGESLLVSGEVSAHIRKARLDAASVAEFEADLTEAEAGIVIISLTGEQTAALVDPEETFEGAWDVQWDSSEKGPITLLQGRVKCYADVTR